MVEDHFEYEVQFKAERTGGQSSAAAILCSLHFQDGPSIKISIQFFSHALNQQ